MSDKEVGAKKRDSVVAIARAEGRLQAVEVRGKSSRFEILWTQTGKDEQSDWGRFAADCGLPAPWGATGTVEQSDGDGRKEVVAGFSSAGVVFNRIEVPAAARADVESIVRFQAESRLPLSAEQMELVWRPGHATNGQMPVTMAAARTDRLRAFVNEVKSILPAKIMLDAEGIVKVWRSFFGGDDGVAVVVSAGANSSQLCMAEGGALVNAVVLDMGVNDFAVGRVQTEATERFVRDVRSILEMFGYSNPDELRIMVLSDGSDTFEAIAGALVSAGLNAGAVGPDVSQIAQGGNLSDETVYDYRLPIGLGLIALEARGDELNIFKRLYSPLEKAEKKSGLYSLIGAGAFAAAMLVVLLVVWILVFFLLLIILDRIAFFRGWKAWLLSLFLTVVFAVSGILLPISNFYYSLGRILGKFNVWVFYRVMFSIVLTIFLFWLVSFISWLIIKKIREKGKQENEKGRGEKQKAKQELKETEAELKIKVIGE